MLVMTSLAGAALAQTPAVPVRSALEPATTGGLEVIDRALAKLSTHRRLLMIGAHPDDEDTSVLTLVVRGLGGEAAYLALSRGDGGQNLIGPELGVGLGVIRTQELVSARRVDGAHQFFTRAYDFGYIRSLDETLERWPREMLMEDVTRVIWRFRPQVVVAMFTPDGGGGHGQHRASGWVAQEVFPIAGDGARFPSLSEEGWLPWQPQSFFRRAFFDPQRASMRFSIGGVDALSGRSMLQIAMQSRSQHRSQDMGMLQPLGTREAGVEWVAGGGGPESTDLFSGVDTRLAAIAAALPEGPVRSAVESDLAMAEQTARQTRSALTPADPAGAIDGLARVLATLRAAHGRVQQSGNAAARRVVSEMIEEKIAVAEVALGAAAGLGLEATSERESVSPGQVTGVKVGLWNAGNRNVTLHGVEIVGAEGWMIERTAGKSSEVISGTIAEWTFDAAVRSTAEPSMPYYLRRPRRGDVYDWSSAEPDVRGLPHQSPELVARLVIEVAGQQLTLEREVVRRTRDQAVGEVRRPVRIVPAVEITVEPSLLLWDPEDSASREIRVVLTSYDDVPIRGRLVARLPFGWVAPEITFAIDDPAGQTVISVPISAPAELEPGFHDLSFEARIDNGPASHLAVPLMEYSHIRPTPLPQPARVRVSVFDLDLPDVGTVGYVRGASDRVPEFLRQVGLAVELLDGETLADGDLSRFRVIVVGSRAYESDPNLAASNSRLVDFVRAGGLLVVQYQQYQFVRGALVPLALEIARPHDRITDENAPVRLLVPDHAAFTTPNQLGDADWQGWVQERGLYFAHTWDEAFEPLMALRDPGMEEQSGGLLVARFGEGTYVYTGLAFFRQLPAGVAGGYRLLANLLALGGGE